jgi:hypothetical protein
MLDDSPLGQLTHTDKRQQDPSHGNLPKNPRRRLSLLEHRRDVGFVLVVTHDGSGLRSVRALEQICYERLPFLL